MDVDNLIRMANRIGDFFEAMPDRAEALEGIANHLQKFWEPRMLREFLVASDAEHADMKPIVREAVRTHRAMLG